MIIYIFVFFISTVFGSFINVVVSRSLLSMDYIFDRSRCLTCQRKLKFWQMIPVLSYLFLKGKCYYCASPIGISNLLVEITSGICGLICYIKYSNVEMIMYFILLLFLLYISLLDWKTKEVKYSHQLILLIMVLCLNIYQAKIYIIEAIITLIVLSFILLITKGIGGADVNIFAIISLLLGNRVIYVYLFSLLYGTIYSIYLLVIKKASRKYQLAFVLFIFLGFISYLILEKEIYIINYLLLK